MARLQDDAQLDQMVGDAIANYGMYAGEVSGLGPGHVDRVFELAVSPLDGFAHCYTNAPYDRQHHIPPGCKVRHFVYVVPIFERHDGEQRLRVGRDGEDLDIAQFFRPEADVGAIYVAMPEQAFVDNGEVQYAFRVRNYFQHSSGVLEFRDDLLFGMELASSTQVRNPRRGVMLVTNKNMFSYQLGEIGSQQAGFKMQYALSSTTAHGKVCPEAHAVLHTQAFGRIVPPPSQQQRMAKFVQEHYHRNTSRTKSGGGGATRGRQGLTHAKLIAGDTKRWDVSVSSAVPIAERASVRLCFVVGSIPHAFRPDAYSARAVAIDALPEPEPETTTVEPFSDAYGDSMRVLGSMLSAYPTAVEKIELSQVRADMWRWPVSNGTAALCVAVRQHDGKDDEEGEALQFSSQIGQQRSYTVEPGLLLRVRVTNMSLSDAEVFLRPVYFATGAASDPDEINIVDLKPQDSWEFPYPLQKDPGERADGWLVQDGTGNTVLSLVFVMSAESLAEFESAREERATSLADARIFIETLHSAMFLSREFDAPELALMESEPKQVECEKMQSELDESMLPDTPFTPTNMDSVTVECCVCLDSKRVAEMKMFVPCGHVACCSLCFAIQARADAAARRGSRCPKCRAPVNNAMKLFF
jgi:hypothetical protein